MRTAYFTALGLVTLAAVAQGCAAPAEETGDSEGAFSKPDLQARFADLRKINTQNLSAIAVNGGADVLNGALRVRSKYVDLGITIADTNVFGAVAEENSLVPASGKTKSLTDIKTGLATELGEQEFPTELAKVRLAHLAKGKDKYFVETGFGFKGAVGLSLNHDAGGFGEGNIALNVGFKKGANVETRVVVASPEAKLGDLLSANGEAISALRGFVVPETTEQVLQMKAGEMVGLKAEGTFAANFGVGVPVLIANAGPFAYSFVVSAGLTHAATGTLDVQFVRLDGDEVVLDVGIIDAKLDEKSLGVTGSWGVNNTCDDGAACLNEGLGKIVRNGLGKKLGAFMKTSVRGSSSQTSNRIELARARFHLNEPEVGKAFEQARHGDLRFAQALASKTLGDAKHSVTFDFDMMRASMTNARSFGADIFGIQLYHRVAVEKTGSFAVQTPNGVQSVLWNSFQKSGGWFQMDHGSQLTAISSAQLNAASPDKAVSRANFIVQSVVGDKHMDDDVLLDSTDALIVTLAGKDALAALDKYGTPMQEAVGRECPIIKAAPQGPKSSTANRDTWDEACNVKIIEDETKKVVQVAGGTLSLVDARKRGVEEFKAQSAVSSAAPAFRDLLGAAADLRLTLQMVKIHALDDNNGPGISFALNYRLDDKALDLLSKADSAEYRASVERYLDTVSAARTGIKGASPVSEGDLKKAGDAMVALFERFQTRYKNLSENESQDLPRVLAGKTFINQPIGIRFDVADVANADGEERMKQFLDDTNRIRVESISHQRALLGKDLFDSLASAADKNVGFSNGKARLFAEQAAAYPLVSVIPSDNLEVGLDLSADVKSTFWTKRDRFIKAGFQAIGKSARGSQVEPISAGMFDINKMMNAR